MTPGNRPAHTTAPDVLRSGSHRTHHEQVNLPIGVAYSTLKPGDLVDIDGFEFTVGQDAEVGTILMVGDQGTLVHYAAPDHGVGRGVT